MWNLTSGMQKTWNAWSVDTPVTTLGPHDYDELDRRLADWDAALARRYPGDDGTRQPIHTVYVPADRYHGGMPAEWGARAGDLLARHAPDPATLADVVGIPVELAADLLPRIVDKLS